MLPEAELANKQQKQPQWLLVRKRTIPTERPTFAAKVIANFCG
jgi:hypothetical protein